MKLTFKIDYRTAWGEQVGVLIEGQEETTPLMLSTTDGYHWEGHTEYAATQQGDLLHYRYAIFRDTKAVRTELGRIAHALLLPSQTGTTAVACDSWRDLPYASYLFTSAFSLQKVEEKRLPKVGTGGMVAVRTLCPCLSKKGQTLVMVGQGKTLGNWVPQKGIALQEIEPGVWQVVLEANSLEECTEYKFVALKRGSLEVAEWEGGDNRRLYVPNTTDGAYYALQEQEVYFPSTNIRVAGTAVPVFSLRSEGSQGVGDFGDLFTMIDWCAETGQRVLQILPINDTTATHSKADSYPYNSISIYAFHPMYVDVRQLDGLGSEAEEEDFKKQFEALNALAEMDYARTNATKTAYLKRYFEVHGERIMASKEATDFVRKNEWLVPYAAFSYLRDQHNTADFRAWPQWKDYDAKRVEQLSKNNAGVAFHIFVQFLLHQQLKRASEHAIEKNVILKGDIPIGISRCSVEAWVEPHYFNMNGQAGAPPDAFAANGQNWGFPTYNWNIMAQDGYAWWKRRFRQMAEYFTAYRIDHILGFFRIWEIPTHALHGILGQFSPALPLTKAEIEGYGLHLPEQRLTAPYIDEALIFDTFGQHAHYVMATCLEPTEEGALWQLKDHCNTQRKIQALAPCDGYSEEAWNDIKEGLFALTNNVLFVKDHTDATKLHPRILGHTTASFDRLTWQEREAFRALHDDFYYHRHNEFWYQKAMEKLPQLLKAAPMMACGEDLGMVPDCVAWVMNQLQILSLEIQRMPKASWQEFGSPWAYPYRSVCTISTHDMATLRGWWEEDAELTRRFYHTQLGHGEPCPAVANANVCEEIVRRNLEAPSILAVLALQDWMSVNATLRYPSPQAERINVPANPNHYWGYRMHITLENLRAQQEFNRHIATLIADAQRN